MTLMCGEQCPQEDASQKVGSKDSVHMTVWILKTEFGIDRLHTSSLPAPL